MAQGHLMRLSIACYEFEKERANAKTLRTQCGHGSAAKRSRRAARGGGPQAGAAASRLDHQPISLVVSRVPKRTFLSATCTCVLSSAPSASGGLRPPLAAREIMDARTPPLLLAAMGSFGFLEGSF